MKKIIIVVVGLLVIGGGLLFVLGGNKSKQPASSPAAASSGTQQANDSTTPPTQNGVNTTPAESSPADSSAAVIVYSDEGFEPKIVKVKSGDKITVQNKSSLDMQFSSDPHPSHSENRELNQNSLPAGGSQTFTVTTRGKWGFHDHLNSRYTGTIVVE